MTKSQIKLSLSLASFEETCEYIYQAFLRKLTIVPLEDRLTVYLCACAEYQGIQLMLVDAAVKGAQDDRFQKVLDGYRRKMAQVSADQCLTVRTLTGAPPGVGAVQGRGYPLASPY